MSVKSSALNVERSAGTGRAVFLSYASQDAGAAKKIGAALRAAGVEVWLDQNELRGGDAWDAKIREQIKACALFVPLLSRHTHERLEGYFRLEWHLAERRMQQMHEDAAFLLPVVIDAAAEAKSRVPAKFFDVQWMRLPEGEPTPALAQRVRTLLAGDVAPARLPSPASKHHGQDAGTPFAKRHPTNFPMSAEKVLIIEDDPTLQRVLKDNFEFHGYDVRVAPDGRKGVQAVFDFKPDLILLDIMLPEVNGFDVCRRIRKEGLATPIIMLTAKSQESDIVLGLNLGADDYVPKPFSIEVLMARAQACLRRRRAAQTDVLEFGDCQLDRSAHKFFCGGQEVFLTPKEFGLLEYFASHLGRALTRTKILDDVWGDDLIVTERSVDRCFNTLRNKVELNSQRPQFICTIRDVGYRFELG